MNPNRESILIPSQTFFLCVEITHIFLPFQLGRSHRIIHYHHHLLGFLQAQNHHQNIPHHSMYQTYRRTSKQIPRGVVACSKIYLQTIHCFLLLFLHQILEMQHYLSNVLPLQIYHLVRTFQIMEELHPCILATNHLLGQIHRILIV